MICDIIYKVDENDNYTVKEVSNRNKVFIASTNSELDSNIIGENIYRLIKNKSLDLPSLAEDLLNIGLAVYATDQIISRDNYGYFNWSRSLIVHIPVINIDIWNVNKSALEELVSFLSGDEWKFEFRKQEQCYVEENNELKEPLTFDKVCLFSGGLDSFIGASKLLASGHKVALVGHHKKGGSELKDQNKAYEVLDKKYPNQADDFFFYVQPSKKEGRENTSRARSFLFISLGIVVAHSIGNNIPLIIPENGLISLNIPLTPSRFGSLSTRTTHPNFIYHFNDLLQKIGVNNHLYNPYQFKTKGQMLKEAQDFALINKNLSSTTSCAHPDIGRWKHGKEYAKHCGYCTPCIIRRAALNFALNGQQQEEYLVSVINEKPEYTKDSWRDYRAFTLALHNYNKDREEKKLLGLKVLSAGPIPNLDDLEQYINVYKNGMKEVGDFLGIKLKQ